MRRDDFVNAEQDLKIARLEGDVRSLQTQLNGLMTAHHVTRQMAEVKLNDIVETAREKLEAHQKESVRDPFDVVIEALNKRCRAAYDAGHDQSGRLAATALAQVRAAKKDQGRCSD